MQSDLNQRRVSVLAVTAYAPDHARLRQIFANTNWKLLTAENVSEAEDVLASREVPVILCERNLADGYWTDVLDLASKQARPARLIVMSAAASESLWGEVLNLGGYDVLEKPLDATSLYSLISQAWLGWNSQAEAVRT